MQDYLFERKKIFSSFLRTIVYLDALITRTLLLINTYIRNFFQKKSI